jgi:hypothetical protein
MADDRQTTPEDEVLDLMRSMRPIELAEEIVRLRAAIRTFARANDRADLDGIAPYDAALEALFALLPEEGPADAH